VTFRTRLVLAATAAVAVAVLLACAGAFLASRNALVNSVDDALVAGFNQAKQGARWSTTRDCPSAKR
jgi:hypothetical protein